MGLQEKIKKLRLDSGISQKKLADSIGVAQSSINYWEKGQRTPSVSAAQKLADYFNITLDELYDIDNSEDIPESPGIPAAHFDGKDHTPGEPTEINEILANTEQLLKQDGLMFDGNPASPEAIESILSAMQIGMEMAKKKNKEKYTPKRYRKDE